MYTRSNPREYKNRIENAASDKKRTRGWENRNSQMHLRLGSPKQDRVYLSQPSSDSYNVVLGPGRSAKGRDSNSSRGSSLMIIKDAYRISEVQIDFT
jgi:hypothetical protein